MFIYVYPFLSIFTAPVPATSGGSGLLGVAQSLRDHSRCHECTADGSVASTEASGSLRSWELVDLSYFTAGILSCSLQEHQGRRTLVLDLDETWFWEASDVKLQWGAHRPQEMAVSYEPLAAHTCHTILVSQACACPSSKGISLLVALGLGLCVNIWSLRKLWSIAIVSL